MARDDFIEAVSALLLMRQKTAAILLAVAWLESKGQTASSRSLAFLLYPKETAEGQVSNNVRTLKLLECRGFLKLLTIKKTRHPYALTEKGREFVESLGRIALKG